METLDPAKAYDSKNPLHRIVLVITLQFSLGSFQGCYATENSRQHLAVLCLLFSSFVATALIEVALIVSGLQGMCNIYPLCSLSVHQIMPKNCFNLFSA